MAMFVLATRLAATESLVVRLGSDSWPPFTDIAENTRIATDLVDEALRRTDVRVETEIEDWKVVLKSILDRSLDGSAAIWHSSERENFLTFSEPYLENRLVLVGRKGSDVSASSLGELVGKRIAVVERYDYGETVKKKDGAIFVQGPSDQSNLEKLLASEVDYMLVDELLIYFVMANQEEEAEEFLEIGSIPMIRRSLHFALRKFLPGANDLIQAFNSEIAKMMADGTYHEILGLRWIRVDVDGDGRLELVPRDDRVGQAPPSSIFSIVSPESPRQDPQSIDRFRIGGITYEGWKNVPDKYKIPASDPFEMRPETRRSESFTFTF